MVDKKKLTKMIIIPLCSFALFLLPIMIPIAITGSTVSLIFKFFEDAGKLGINKSVDAMKELIQQFKTTETYQNVLNKIRTEVDSNNIKYSKIIIPLLFLQELETDNTDKYIRVLLELAKSYEANDRYVAAIKRHTLFEKKLNDLTESHMYKTLNELSILFDEDVPLSQEQLANSGELLYPLRNKAIVTSEFGARKINVNGRNYDFFHNGIDLAYGSESSTCGVSIYAIHDGMIHAVDKESSGNAGNYVIIYNQEKNLKTAYFHLQLPPRWNVGEHIKKGEVVGLIGTTGLSTGCHLHLQMGTSSEWKNPRQYLNFDTPTLP